jgi:hypothetical protein
MRRTQGRLFPEARGVGFETVQQASEGVMGWRLGSLGLHAGGLCAGGDLGGRHQEVDVVLFRAARWVHRPNLTRPNVPRNTNRTPTA